MRLHEYFDCCYLQIKVEESFWTLEDKKVMIIHLEKVGRHKQFVRVNPFMSYLNFLSAAAK